MPKIVADFSREIRLRSLVGLFWLSATALRLLAQAPPSQDTFVASSKPNNNYGSNASLAVQSGSTNASRQTGRSPEALQSVRPLRGRLIQSD